MTKKNVKRTIPTVGVSLVVAFLLIKGAMLQPEINQNKEKIGNLNSEIIREEQNLNELDELSKTTDTDEYIEKVAREKLGLVKENEIIFIDVSGE